MADHWDLERTSQEWEKRGLDRRQLMKLLGAGAGLSALTTLFTSGSAAASAQGEETQVSIHWKKPQTLGPLFSTAGFEQQVERLVLGALVKMTDQLEQVGDLAETIDVAPDATSFTFHLRQNAAFNDGTPLTSDDVRFTIERAIDVRTGSIWRGRLLGITGAAAYSDQTADSVTGVETPDEHTVTIKLDKPDAAFLQVLADYTGFSILPKHILGEVAPDQLVNNEFNLNPSVGAGAYNFVQYASDQYVELEANPTFWGTAPAVQRLFLRILQPDVAIAELENGSIDLVSIAIDDIERLEKNETLTVVTVPSPSMDSISFNLDREYFQDKRLRQAFAYAIDRENITKEIYKGYATVRNSPIFGPDWMGVPEVNPYPFDPDKARQLVTESGWDPNREVEMMFVPGGNKTFDNMVPIIQAQLADVGVKINLLQLDAAELNKKLVADSDYDLYIGGGGVYGADPGISAKYYISSNLTPTGANSVRYVNPEIDELYAEGRQTGDQAARKEIYNQIATILNEDMPSVFLWSPTTNFAFSKRLQGFLPPSYVDNRLWNAEEWSVTA
jgi:peptide/nickel transport system substrate-binding protein